MTVKYFTKNLGFAFSVQASRRRDSRFDACVSPNIQICSVLNVFFRFILNESLFLTKVFSSFFHLAVLNVEVLVLKLKEMNKCKIARGDI